MLAKGDALSDQEIAAYLFDCDLDDEIVRAEHALELFNSLGCGPARGAFLDRLVTLDRRVGAGKDPDEPYQELLLLNERALLRIALSPKPYGEDPKWIPTFSNIQCAMLAQNVAGWQWEMRHWSAPPANEHSRAHLTIRLVHGGEQLLSGQRRECDAIHALFHAFIVPNLTGTAEPRI